MMPRTGTQQRRVKKLAGAGFWIAAWAGVAAAWAGVALVSASTDWTWVLVAAVCTLALAALSVIAAVAGLRADGRWRGIRRKGGGLSTRGRDDDDGLAGEAAHRWHTLAVMSRLMPRSGGRRWLAEAESLLAEVTAARRGAAVRSYLLSAPRLAVMMWAREVLRRARLGRAARGESRPVRR
jgi:hypothetical protein